MHRVLVKAYGIEGQRLQSMMITLSDPLIPMIRQMCRWLKENHLANAPLHFSRFFPRYKFQDIPPTPLHTLQEAKRIAEDEGIVHVYLGNV